MMKKNIFPFIIIVLFGTLLYSFFKFILNDKSYFTDLIKKDVHGVVDSLYKYTDNHYSERVRIKYNHGEMISIDEHNWYKADSIEIGDSVVKPIQSINLLIIKPNGYTFECEIKPEVFKANMKFLKSICQYLTNTLPRTKQ